MSARYTPGPWERFDREIHCRPVEGSLAKLIVAKVAGDDDESEANARLIAAAPELLTALCQYRSDLLHPTAPDSRERRLAMIDALLAKAGAA